MIEEWRDGMIIGRGVGMEYWRGSWDEILERELGWNIEKGVGMKYLRGRWDGILEMEME